MKKRLLLIVVGALFFGGAHAQEMPSIGRTALWSVVKSQLLTITRDDFLAMFGDGTPPAIVDTGYEFTVPFNVAGNVYLAKIRGGNARYAWSYAASQGYEGDTEFQCFIVGVCRAAVGVTANNDTVSDRDYYFEFRDDFGVSRGGFFISETTSGTTKLYKPQVNQAFVGDGRGGANMFTTGFSDTCGTAWTGSGNNVETYDQAYNQMYNKLDGIKISWGLRATKCVPYTMFLGQTTSLVDAWASGIEDASRRNVNPLNFFYVEGIEVTDDTPPPPDPNAPRDTDGDGIPDSEDQYPYDPTNTPPESNWDVTPIDSETQCRAIDIPCNFRKLFIPQVDWPQEWGEMRAVLETKFPFAIATWFEITAGAGGTCPTIDYMGVQLNPCQGEAYTWWMGQGSDLLFAMLYIGMLFYFAGKAI